MTIKLIMIDLASQAPASMAVSTEIAFLENDLNELKSNAFSVGDILLSQWIFITLSCHRYFYSAVHSIPLGKTAAELF